MEARETIKELLEQKAALKQDIFEDTCRQFKRFKKAIHDEIEALRTAIPDDRVRVSTKEQGEFELQVFIGSDVLVFQMHTNIFRLPNEHPLWKTEYLKEDKQLGYFGIINVYNFLADSYLKNRLNDIGYLIGRIMVNREEHFMIEGKGQLGFLFRDLTQSKLNDATITNIVHVCMAYALEFDLLTPPYDVVSKVTVNQLVEMNSINQIATGKRLGFKFEAEDKDFF